MKKTLSSVLGAGLIAAAVASENFEPRSSVHDGNIQVSYNTDFDTNKTYAVQRSYDLTASNSWETVSESVGNGRIQTYSEAASTNQAYFRVQMTNNSTNNVEVSEQ